MKASVIAILIFIVGLAVAEANDLAFEMQTAVLKTQDIQKVQELLNRGFDANASIGCGSYSALDGAIDMRNVEMVKLLLAHKAKPHGYKLTWAAFAPHPQALEMVKALVEAGVDPNTPGNGLTALAGAIARENKELVAFLLSQPGITLNDPDIDGYTPLMLAVAKGSSELVDMLLRAGAKVNTPTALADSAIVVAEREIAKQHAIIEKLKAAGK